MKNKRKICIDRFSYTEGETVFSYPRYMTVDEYEDLEKWMELQLRKLKRWATNPILTEVEKETIMRAL